MENQLRVSGDQDSLLYQYEILGGVIARTSFLILAKGDICTGKEGGEECTGEVKIMLLVGETEGVGREGLVYTLGEDWCG